MEIFFLPIFKNINNNIKKQMYIFIYNCTFFFSYMHCKVINNVSFLIYFNRKPLIVLLT